MKRVAILLSSALLFTGSTALAQDSFFDIWTEASVFEGPPYPTESHNAHVAHDNGGVLRVDGNFSLGIGEAAGRSSGAPLPTSLHGTDGLPPGQFNVDSFFDIDYRVGGGDFQVDSFFDIWVECTANDGSPGSLVPEDPAVPDSFFDIDYQVDSFFDIEYRVDYGTGGYHHFILRCEAAPGFTLGSPQVDVNTGNAPGLPGLATTTTVDSFFDISFDVDATGVYSGDVPIILIHQTGTFVESPTPVVPTTWGQIKSKHH